MKMSTADQKLVRYSLVFLGIGIIFTFFPIYSSVQLVKAITSDADSIAFDKGAYYLSGGSLLFTIGPGWFFYVLLFKKNQAESKENINPKRTQRVQRNVYIFFAICIATMITLPQVVSVAVGQYLENRGYTYCDKQSRQWLLNRTLVYTKKVCN